MKSFGVNSLYRNVRSHQAKEPGYKDFTSASAPSHHLGVAASSKWVAFPSGGHGGRSCFVLPLDLTGDPRQAPLIHGHGAPVTALEFSPFHRDLLVTACSDGAVKAWKIDADGLSDSRTECDTSVSFSGSAVNALAFHPSASDVLAVGGQRFTAVVDLESGNETLTVPHASASAALCGMDFNHDGSALWSVHNDSTLRLMDLRVGGGADPAVSMKLDVKPQHVSLITADGHIAVLGANRTRESRMLIYDSRMLEKPLVSRRPGTLSSGKLLASFDKEAKLLHITTRSSPSLFVFDYSPMLEGKNELQCTAHNAGSSIQGFAPVPKFALDLAGNEVNRLMTVTTDNKLHSVSFKVPRARAGYDDALFPYSAASSAALTADQWFAGENAEPPLWNLNPNLDLFKMGTAAAASAAGAAPSASGSAAAWRVNSLKKQAEEEEMPKGRPRSRTEDMWDEYQEKVASQGRSMIDKAMKQSVYQNTSATQPRSLGEFLSHVERHSDPKPGVPVIVANDRWLAIPWKIGGGSAVGVFRHDSGSFGGRVPKDVKLLKGHSKPCTALDIGNQNPDLLATGGQDGHVRLWQMPVDGTPLEDPLPSDASEGIADLLIRERVSQLKFHDQVANLLAVATCNTYAEDSAALRLWDTQACKEALAVSAGSLGDNIESLDWNFDGSLVASWSASRSGPGLVRIIDPRANSVVNAFEPPEHQRAQVRWGAASAGGVPRIVTLGTGTASARSVSLFDLRTDGAVATHELGKSASLFATPHLDVDTQQLYVADVGGRKVRVLEIGESSIEEFAGYTAPRQIQGMAFVSKLGCDVRKVELARGFVLGKDSVYPISFSVLRKRAEFFQDDLYPLTRSMKPLMTAEQWTAGKSDVVPEMVSLCPDGLEPLSQAPAEGMSDRQRRHMRFLYEQRDQEARGIVPGGKVIEHFQEQAAPASNRWDATLANPDVQDVDEDEWGDSD